MLDDKDMGIEEISQEKVPKAKEKKNEPEDKIEIPQKILDSLSETKDI